MSSQIERPAGSPAVVLILVGVGAMFFSLRGFFGRSEAASIASDRTFICAETGKPFNHKLVRGERTPGGESPQRQAHRIPGGTLLLDRRRAHRQ